MLKSRFISNMQQIFEHLKMTSATGFMYWCNTIIVVAVSANKTRSICKCTFHMLVPAYSTIYVGVTLCLQFKSADNLAVNHSTEETISASGRLASYLYPPCSAGVC